MLIGVLGFAALAAVILNKAMSLIVVLSELPAMPRSNSVAHSQAIRTWRQGLLDEGRSPIVAAKSYRLLRAVFNTAVKEDRLIGENPCRIRGYDKEDTAERPVGSVSGVVALSGLIDAWYRALVLFAALTGLRWG